MVELQYPTFEANQVLTEKHLNALREYFQEEDKRTRARGIGVGILGGFEVSVIRAEGRITRIDISCGAGITTGGYLLHIADDCELTHYRKFADADPHRYELFWMDVEDPPRMKDGIWELREGDDDGQSASLSAPAADAELGDVSQLVVVLYAECREEQVDACNLEDCDDKGADVRINVRKLLVRKEILPEIVLPFGREELEPLHLERAADFSGVGDLASFAEKYKQLYARAIPPIAQALGATWWRYRKILKSVDRHWIQQPIFENAGQAQARVATALGVLRDTTPDDRIQVFYDFLRDVIATHNAFVACAAELKNWGCVNEDDFPRHLALSELPPPPKTHRPVWRHEFRPLLATVCQERVVYKLRRLFKKIDLVADLYDPGQTAVEVAKIRPQRHISPSTNVIPYYYDPTEGERFAELKECWDAEDDPISAVHNRVWTFGEVTQSLPPDPDERGDDPVLHSLDDQDFLRIEGHLGQPEATARARIDGLRRSLAFDLVSLRLGAPDSVGFGSLCDYEEHRARYDEARHALLWKARQIYFYLDHLQLGISQKRNGWLRYVSPGFPIAQTSAVLQAINAWTLTIPPQLEMFEENALRAGHAKLLEAAYWLLAALHGYSEEITAKPYNSFHDLSEVDKSDAPYSILVALIICQIRVQVLRIFIDLDVNILLRAWSWAHSARHAWSQNHPETLPGYIRHHSGMDHAAGTTKDGTFILVHDGNKVVGDFYLPYRCCEPPCLRVSAPPFEECLPVYLESDYKETIEVFDLEVLREKSGSLESFKNVQVTIGNATGRLSGSNPKWYPFQKTGGSECVALRFAEDVHRWPQLVLHRPESWIRAVKEAPGSRTIELAVNTEFLKSRRQTPPCHVMVWLYIHPPLAIASDLTAVTVMGKPVTIDLLSDSLLPDNSFQLRLIASPQHGKIEEVAPEEAGPTNIQRTVKYSPAGRFVGRDTFDFEVSSRLRGREWVSCGRVTVHVTDCCDPEPPQPEPEKPDITIPGPRDKLGRPYFCYGDTTNYLVTTRGPVIQVGGPGIADEIRVATLEGRFGSVFLRPGEGELELIRTEAEPGPVPIEPLAIPSEPLDVGGPQPLGGTLGVGDTIFSMHDNPIGDFLVRRADLPWFTAAAKARARFLFSPARARKESGGDTKITIWYSYQEGNTQKKGEKEVVLVDPLPAEFHEEIIEIDEDDRSATVAFFGPEVQAGVNYHWDFGQNAKPRESTADHQRVKFDLRQGVQATVLLSLRYKQFPKCYRSIPRIIDFSIPEPDRLGDKYIDIHKRWPEIVEGLVEVVTEEESARLEAAAEHLPFVKEVVTVEGGAKKYGEGDYDPLVLDYESRQLEATTELIQTKYKELKEREEAEGAPAGEYTRKVEPLVELARTQLEGGLSYVKHKNRSVNDNDVRYINAAGHQLATLKELGVEIDTEGKTTALLRETREDVKETTFLDQLNALEKIVEAP